MKRIVRLGLIAVVVASMASFSAFANGQNESSNAKKHGQLRIWVVYHDTSIQFAQLIKAGALAAGKKYGVDVKFTGPVGIHPNQEVNIIEDAITEKVDGLAISNVNGQALNPVIHKAIAAGIPTVTFNSDDPHSGTMAFFGQNLVASGLSAGKILAGYIHDKGKVLIISADAAAAWSQQREKGAREALSQFPGITVVNTINAAGNDQDQYAAIENAIRGNPGLAGIVDLDAGTTTNTGTVLKRDNIKTIAQVGFDLIPQTLRNIKEGWTKASLSQNPYIQGYDPVKALYEYLTKKVPLKSVDTGILRVDSTNVDKYLQKLKNGEPVG